MRFIDITLLYWWSELLSLIRFSFCQVYVRTGVPYIYADACPLDGRSAALSASYDSRRSHRCYTAATAVQCSKAQQHRQQCCCICCSKHIPQSSRDTQVYRSQGPMEKTSTVGSSTTAWTNPPNHLTLLLALLAGGSRLLRCNSAVLLCCLLSVVSGLRNVQTKG